MASNRAIEQVEILQAVVILESYSSKFKPLSNDTAECLLPLLGKPLIDYTLEFLLEQGVEEIYVFCSNHFDQIKSYLNSSKWKNFNVNLHRNVGCSSFGRSMREITRLFDTTGLARTHFILVTAPGVVGLNVKIRQQFDAHKERYKANKSAIMTVACIEKSNDLNLNFSNQQNQTYFIHNSHNVMLSYYNSYDTKSSYAIPLETMEHLNNLDNSGTRGGVNVNVPRAASRLKLRSDLYDTQIYFCSAHVLKLFEDNFETETMSDLIHAIISDTVSSNMIYLEILNRTFGTYLTTINCLNTYYFQTMKLLQRADAFNLGSSQNLKIENVSDSLNVLLNKKSLKVGRNVCFKRNVFIESGCEIGDGCVLMNCYVGKKCKIGTNVNISNAIIFENVVIGDNVSLNAGVIGLNVKIGKNCKLTENILFSNDCDIKENTVFDNCGIYHVSKEDTSTGFSDDEDEDGDSVEKLPLKVEKLNIDENNYTRYVMKDSLTDGDEEDAISGAETDDESDIRSMDQRRADTGTQIDEAYHTLRQFYIWPIKKSKVYNKVRTSDKRSDNEDEHDEFEDEDYVLDEDEDSDEESEKGNEDDEDEDEEDEHADENQHDDNALAGALNNLLERVLRERTYDIENLKIEIAGVKSAYYAEIGDLSYSLAQLLLEYPLKHKQLLMQLRDLNEENANYLNLMVIIAELYKKVLEIYFCKDRQSQFIFLNSILDFYVAKTASKQVDEASYVKLMLKLNQDFELLDDNLVVAWHKEKLKATAENNDTEKQRLLTKLNTFVEWLQEDDEDDDDDE